MKAEREYWHNLCMQEVRGLENSCYERIKLVEDMATRMQEEATRSFQQKLEAERTERATALAEMRRDLGVQRDLQEQVGALRRELNLAQNMISEVARGTMKGTSNEAMDAAMAGLRSELNHVSSQCEAGLSELRAFADKTRFQVSAAEAAISDLRDEVSNEKEQHQLQVEGTQASISALEANHRQAMQDQTLRSSADLSKSIQDVTAALAATQGSLTADLKTEIEKIRGEIARLDNVQASQIGEVRSQSNSLREQLEVSNRRLQLFEKDQLSESSMMQGRLEEQGHRAAEVTRLVGRLDGLEAEYHEEKRTSSALATRVVELEGQVAAVSRATAAVPMEAEPAQLLARLESMEASVQVALTMAGQQTPMNPSSQGGISQQDAAELKERVGKVESRMSDEQSLDALSRRLAAVEQRGPSAAVPAAAPSAAAQQEEKDLQGLLARIETVEALFLARSTAGDAAPEPGTRPEDIQRLDAALESIRSEIDRVGRDVAEERSDRCRALADVSRLTEDVAKATAAAMERRSEAATSVGEHHSLDVSGISAIDEARRLGNETSAELKAEINSRVRSIIAEFRGDIQGEVSVRMASSEARIGTMEARLDGELKRVAMELNQRVGRLEAGSGMADMVPRVTMLESETKKNSLMLTMILEERLNKKAAASAIEAIESDVRKALNVGRSGVNSTSVDMLSVSGTGSLAGMSAGGGGGTGAGAGSGGGGGGMHRSSSGSSLGTGTAPAATTDPASGKESIVATPMSAGSASHRSASQQAGEKPAGISHGLKQSLEGLVTAVHRTLNTKGPKEVEERPQLSQSQGNISREQLAQQMQSIISEAWPSATAKPGGGAPLPSARDARSPPPPASGGAPLPSARDARSPPPSTSATPMARQGLGASRLMGQSPNTRPAHEGLQPSKDEEDLTHNTWPVATLNAVVANVQKEAAEKAAPSSGMPAAVQRPSNRLNAPSPETEHRGSRLSATTGHGPYINTTRAPAATSGATSGGLQSPKSMHTAGRGLYPGSTAASSAQRGPSPPASGAVPKSAVPYGAGMRQPPTNLSTSGPPLKASTPEVRGATNQPLGVQTRPGSSMYMPQASGIRGRPVVPGRPLGHT